VSDGIYHLKVTVTPSRKNEGRADLSSVTAPLFKKGREKKLDFQPSITDNKVLVQLLLCAAGVTCCRRNFRGSQEKDSVTGFWSGGDAYTQARDSSWRGRATRQTLGNPCCFSPRQS